MIFPKWITFTGVDEFTDMKELMAISSAYPVEWGVLFSPQRSGYQNRYPGIRALPNILKVEGPFSAHLCGRHSQEVMLRRFDLALPHYWNSWRDFAKVFNRVQVNHTKPLVEEVALLQASIDTDCILQTRSSFPDDGRVSWLFDRSGGRGTTSDFWPKHPGNSRIVGYAGGIGPDNVREILQKIDCNGLYWIDVEGRVRDEHDKFDLTKVRKVCEQVYG